MKSNITVKILSILCFAYSFNISAQEEQKINDVLKQRIEYNKANRKAKGYKIQLYNGNETKAYQIKGNFEVAYGIVAVLSYESPEWKVRVGNYKTRLEADRALLKFKEKFSGAIVLETLIRL
jgi:hypothetical protein